jgi:predicted Zn-dependent peptidase
MLLNPLFHPAKIKTEMKNIVQEIKRYYYDDAITYSIGKFNAAIYGKHPFANPEMGTKKSVLSFGRKDFLEWKEKFYYPENFIFIIAGGLEPQKAKFFIDKFFNIKPSGHKSNKRIIPASLVGPTPRFLFVPRAGQQVNIYIGTAVAEGSSLETRALDFFADMIYGGSQSGPLFQEVRDKRGLAYSVKAGVDSFNLLSSFFVYVGTDPSKCKEVAEIVFKVIDENKNSRKLFEKAKTRVLGAIDLQFDSMDPESIASLAAQNIIIRGKPLVFEDMKEEIEAITLEEVEAAVNKYLNPDRLTTVVVGPEPKK